MDQRKFMVNFRQLKRFLRNENARTAVKTMVLVFFLKPDCESHFPKKICKLLVLYEGRGL